LLFRIIVNFVKESDLTVIKEIESVSDPTEYSIVDCILNGEDDIVPVCRQTSGYVLNKKSNNVYGFIGSGEGEDVTNRLNGGSECNDKNIGKYIKSGSDYFICIDGKNVKFEKEESKFMIMGGSAAENTPFTEDEESVLIKRGSYYVIRDKFTVQNDDGKFSFIK